MTSQQFNRNAAARMRQRPNLNDNRYSGTQVTSTDLRGRRERLGAIVSIMAIGLRPDVINDIENRNMQRPTARPQVVEARWLQLVRPQIAAPQRSTRNRCSRRKRRSSRRFLQRRHPGFVFPALGSFLPLSGRYIAQSSRHRCDRSSSFTDRSTQARERSISSRSRKRPFLVLSSILTTRRRSVVCVITATPSSRDFATRMRGRRNRSRLLRDAQD